MKKHINKIIPGVIILIILAFVFWYGGDVPSNSNPKENLSVEQRETIINDNDIKENDDFDDVSEKENSETEEKNKAHSLVIEEPTPVEPENMTITDQELTCTLSIRCDTILKNMNWVDKEKIDIIPQSGIIFAEKTVVFYEGESVFNLLVREMKKNNIHLEFENTPIYKSAYIEGIKNIYEFDCGELSGWMYKVNGWFPNYGCSRYQLKAGDKVEWVYTCDLGADIGGNYSARNGN